MTHAVLIVLISLALLFILNVIFLLVLLKPRVKFKSSQTDNGILIVYASQSGQAESYAVRTVEQLIDSGYSVQTLNIADFNADSLNNHHQVLWMVSTYGEGDAPDTGRQFIQKVMTKSFELNDIQYAILAFGDRHYSNFCEFGKQIEAWLVDQHAQALFPMICVDQLNQSDLAHWQTQLDKVFQHSPSKELVLGQRPFQPVRLSERYLLNQGSLGHPMYHLVLTQVEALSWQSGDILEIQCANTHSQINEFIQTFKISVESGIDHLDISNILKFKNLRTFDASQNFDQWLLESKDLPIREYSIASISSQNQLELVVRQEINEDGLGLGSGYLTQFLALGDILNGRIRSNPAFHLIENDQPIILIGNGSGIAGLMSHIRQRESLDFQQNWLIYGERQQAIDVGFIEQLSLWKQSGVLTDVDLVFSRDSNSSKYVQDCLIAKSDQVKMWIERGASIYICGSLKGMAQGVETALIQILGYHDFEQLLEQKRYLRDVY